MISCEIDFLTDGNNFVVNQTFSGEVCNRGTIKISGITYEVKDGNEKSILKTTGVVLFPDGCATFSDISYRAVTPTDIRDGS